MSKINQQIDLLRQNLTICYPRPNNPQGSNYKPRNRWASLDFAHRYCRVYSRTAATTDGCVSRHIGGSSWGRYDDPCCGFIPSSLGKPYCECAGNTRRNAWDSRKNLIAFNKVDKVDSETWARVQQDYPQAVFISATQHLGLETLKMRSLQLIDIMSG